MNSKQTDYINAQFNDAFERVALLFKKIKKQSGEQDTREIASQYIESVKNNSGQSYIFAYFAYKKGGRVRMTCFAVLADLTSGWGFSGHRATIQKKWGIPPRRYEITRGSRTTIVVEPTDSGIAFSCVRGDPGDNSCFVIEDSWDY